jgi:hypothetical protein
VRAAHRTPGEPYLLIYEDPAHRRRPVQIIHFVSSGVKAQRDSTR